MRQYGHIIGKFLTLLANGAMLGLVRGRKERLELFKDSDRIWHSLDRKQVYQILNRLKLQNYVEFIKERDNIKTVRLTNRGRARFLSYQFNTIKLPESKRWDKRWRMVLFDIPESKKKIRDALRRKLKALGFLEFQKSVFIYPYSCRDEINFVINFYNISEHVYYLEAPIVPDGEFRKHFKI